jgi:aflatoxin B1 aldehyde reductase
MGQPRIIFGAATVGMGFDDPQAVAEILDLLKKHNIDHIDTAGRYPPLNPGLSETLLGEADAVQRGFLIDTKVLAGPGDGSGELTNSVIKKSLSTSLQRLKSGSVRRRNHAEYIVFTDKKQINTLHCHRPDPKTPLVEQAASLDRLYRQGKFKAVCLPCFPFSSSKSKK